MTADTPVRQDAPEPVIRPLRAGDHVVVIGAGPAGLTAAYLLLRAGARVTVLEAGSSVGGLSRTEVYKGFRFDLGGHRFFTKIPEVEALWREWLGSEFIKVPRLSRIQYRGRLFDYPLRARNALAGLGLWETLLVLMSYAKVKLWPRRPETTFEDWVSNRFGQRLYEIFFKTYTEKVWGIPCTEIRAEWAAQRIQNLSLWKAVLGALNLQRRSTVIKTLIHEFDYPRLGPGQMWEACARRVTQAGGEVQLQTVATGLSFDQRGVTGVTVYQPGGQRTIDAAHVISTMPLQALVEASAATVPAPVSLAAAGLRYRDFMVVALILDMPSPFPDNWIYVHTPGVAVGRVQNFTNWSPALVPRAGHTCLGLEYFCFAGDELWSRPDGDLLDLAKAELGQLGLGDPTRVVDGSVVRVRYAYPIYDTHYAGHLQVIREWLDPISNLHSIGRNGMHRYNNQDHSMLTAILTVRNMLGGREDVWAVNTDYEYHEEQRVPTPG